MTKPLSLCLLLIFVSLFGYVAKTFLVKPQTSLPVLASLETFYLKDQNSLPFTKETLSQGVWVAHTFFTSCQGPCPLMAGQIAQLQKDFAETKVRFLSLSVDPANDTPEVLKNYAKRFHAKDHVWFLVTGQRKSLEDLIKTALSLPMEEDANLHSLRFVLIDALGNVRGYYDSQDADKMTALRSDLTRLLGDV